MIFQPPERRQGEETEKACVSSGGGGGEEQFKYPVVVVLHISEGELPFGQSSEIKQGLKLAGRE